MQTRRAEMQSAVFRKKLHVRSGIEGTLSELVRGHGFRNARYRGQLKLRLQAYFTAVAVNLKRVIRWWTRPQKNQMAFVTP
jgi:transposase